MSDDATPMKKNWRGKARADQGCQLVCFQTKNPSLGKFWRALEFKLLV
jgi:hypothetical protein